MKKLFYIVIFIVFISAVFFVVAGKLHFIGDNFLVADKHNGVSGGDLYNFSKYKGIQEQMILQLTYQNDFDECTVIAMGDSFFDSSWDSKRIPDLLADEIDQQVCFIRISPDYRPFEHISNLNLSDYSQRKLLILETVERQMATRLNSNLFKNEISSADVSVKSDVKKVVSFTKIKELIKSFFNNDDVEYFFRNNVLVDKIRSQLMHYRFEYLSETVPQVGGYTVDKEVFYFQETFVEKDVDKIDSQVETMIEFQKQMDGLNLDVLFVVIPDKVTIYPDNIAGGYEQNNYLQNFLSKLSESSVSFVDVYDSFQEYKDQDFLYYRGDTHINTIGKNILVELMVGWVEEYRD
ncbi:hypothetical protein HN958_01235 [Candidatus Falkowbacteria bacterium]|jgi:hypothetical protein|nr:hypothetical protein [Candidatus Falkowbacteria bacterium]MBT7007111.1 hypothetical protein [Candidatus Falkowbacteria bacterium]